jgi:hypothetical protein
MKLLLLLSVLALASPVQAEECHGAQLRRIVHDRDPAATYTLVTADGAHLRLDGQDSINPREWRRGAALKICPEPAGPEAVVVEFRIENTDRGETLFGVTPRQAASAVR